ncbi:hypothetical protein [Robertkochia sediminum]|uniref:hypothetical protein n=1 Tax=Robertkochia sediminum TaxID=2785326 RepID=UPI001931ED15|nr:hypothetical protein [Robertkochia sediminum]MBL7473303.1 hypothetical protein [Robertkochia sediminum]
MNYIRHLNNFGALVYGKNDYKPAHISLYLSLFFSWNTHRFAKRIPVYRDEMMKQSRIKSRSTYQNTLRELQQFKLIEYYPSNSPNVPSEVHLLPLDQVVQSVGPKVGQLSEPLYKHSKPLNKKFNKKGFLDALKTKNNKDYNEPL